MKYEGQICRAPMERSAFMLPIAVGCSYNACKFCTLFKHLKYRELPLEQVKEEILRVKSVGGNPKRVFLGDGNAFGIDTEKLLTILGWIREAFPACEGVNMDATVTDIRKKSDEELSALKKAGIDQLYLGIETGLDDVLAFMVKDHTLSEVYEAIERLHKAGIDYDSHMMTGIAGKGRGIENAEAIAKFYNETNPKKICNFSLFLHKDSPLYKDIESGAFVPADELDNLIEARRIIELLKVNDVEYDGFHDYVGVRIRGKLPKDKQKMLEKLDKAIEELKDKEPVYSYVCGCGCEQEMYNMVDPAFRK